MPKPGWTNEGKAYPHLWSGAQPLVLAPPYVLFPSTNMTVGPSSWAATSPTHKRPVPHCSCEPGEQAVMISFPLCTNGESHPCAVFTESKNCCGVIVHEAATTISEQDNERAKGGGKNAQVRSEWSSIEKFHLSEFYSHATCGEWRTASMPSILVIAEHAHTIRVRDHARVDAQSQCA